MKDDMSERGNTRPGMHHDHKEPAKHHSGMDTSQREEMLHMHHMKTLWIYWMLMILGAWLILSPLTFDYGKSIVQPSGGREVWLSLSDRIRFLKWSDIISGMLLLIFGYRSLVPNRPISLWICCFIGIWISIAPLLFWAPTAAIYLNDTLVGMLIISLSILIPGMPNMIMFMKMGSEVPEGWSYNPSSWPQRWIMILTGFLGFVVSRYLAAYQLGYIDDIWDPIFGSSAQVLNSKMSQSLFISDAGLGSLAYTFEFLMGFMGSPSRWRTMPWMVALFGILVIPLGLVHIFLVISQPLVVGAWCFFCLVAAGIMLPMIPLEIDEVIAMGQHMVQATRRGEKFWTVFWKGGQAATQNKDERSPDLMALNQHFGKVFRASVWGMTVPVTLLLTTIAGILLMMLPDFFGVPVQDTLADINHLCGALIVVCSVIAMGEVVRALRYVNILLAIIIAVAPWLTGGDQTSLNIINSIAGLLVIALSIPRGIKRENYGLWDKYII